MIKLAFVFAIGLAVILGGMQLLGRSNSDASLAPSTRASQMFTSDRELAWPIDRGEERERKLTFGLYVTPDPSRNPIDPPERFTGYHAALDLEILPGEEDVEVPIKAACDGQILQADEVAGYGGVIIQSCIVGNEEVTALYGHLDFRQFQVKTGEAVKRSDLLGFLGEHKSEESGDTRKHLHFGLHRGLEIEVRGYVLDEKELESYLDPLPLLEGN